MLAVGLRLGKLIKRPDNYIYKKHHITLTSYLTTIDDTS